MIVSSEGKIVLTGEASLILAELTAIIKEIRSAMIEKGFSEDFANEQIAIAGKLAFMAPEEIDKELKEAAESLDADD